MEEKNPVESAYIQMKDPQQNENHYKYVDITILVLHRIGEKRKLLNNVPCRKANGIGHILRRNCLLHDAIEGQMKVVGRRRTQVLDDLRNKKILGAKGDS